MINKIKEHFQIISLSLLLVIFLKQCGTSRDVNKIEKNVKLLSSEVMEIKAKTFTQEQLAIELRITGLEAEKRMMMVCIFGAAPEDDSDEVKERGALYPHLWGYTPQTLTDLCKAIGFKDIKILQPRGKHPGKNFRLEAVK
jgi:hypothetical protein